MLSFVVDISLFFFSLRCFSLVRATHVKAPPNTLPTLLRRTLLLLSYMHYTLYPPYCRGRCGSTTAALVYMYVYQTNGNGPPTLTPAPVACMALRTYINAKHAGPPLPTQLLLRCNHATPWPLYCPAAAAAVAAAAPRSPWSPSPAPVAAPPPWPAVPPSPSAPSLAAA